jgi:hypothetical protein
MSAASSHSEQRILLSGITWSTFESLLADTKNHGTRFTYELKWTFQTVRSIR